MVKKLNWTSADNGVKNRFKSLQGKDWSTTYPEVKEFRARLLVLQKWTCAYCKCPIDSDDPGHRELDHILPKGKSGKCSVSKCFGENYSDRRHTNGYPQFKYHPKNFAVCCKACNSSKGSFDPLKDRRKSRVNYPAANSIFWFNPNFDDYSAHVSVSREFTYRGVTTAGKYLIEACGLDQAIQLKKRFEARAISKLARSSSLRLALINMATAVNSRELGKQAAKSALLKKYRGSQRDLSELLDLWVSALSDKGGLNSLTYATQRLQVLSKNIAER